MISDNENRVLEAVRQCGPLEAYRRLIAENNALIRGPDLKNGRAITTMRTAIHTVLAGQWAEEQQRMLSYDKPFALVALGGTGREEVTPCSDLDFAFLFDDALEICRCSCNAFPCCTRAGSKSGTASPASRYHS